MQPVQQSGYSQLIRFGLTGLANTSIDWGVYFALTRFVWVFQDFLVAAKIISFAAASVFAFLVHRFWTFQRVDGIEGVEIIKFYVTTLSAMAINALALHLLVGIFRMNDLLALIPATALTMVWNFLFLKFWVYAPRWQTLVNH